MKQWLCLVFLLNSLGAFAQTLEDDRLALLAFYNATGGVNWLNNTGWSSPQIPGQSPCAWYGVSCDPEGNRVTALSLRFNRLDGILPAEIGELTRLVLLNLNGTGTTELGDYAYNHSLGGDLPPELGYLINLEYLDLGANHFSGTIPTSLGNLAKLTYLNLFYLPVDFPNYRGRMTGTIPDELGNLTKLKYLDLATQNFTGAIPHTLGNLTNLERLHLNDNSLTGAIPAQLGNLVNLDTLNLNSNRLSGNVPSTFSDLIKLRYLGLGYIPYLPYDRSLGELNGPIPDFSALSPDAEVFLYGQSFTFSGMENNTSRLKGIGYQRRIPMYLTSPANLPPGSSSPFGILSVDAGGTLANNTYKWYKNGVLLATNTGNNLFSPLETGTYRVEVNNRIVIPLKLISENFVVTALPVTLHYFQGKSFHNENHLTWTTTAETNNSGFEIERSQDAKTFEKIGFVDGNGDSEVQHVYNFVDQNPFPTSYYRLKQIDRAAGRVDGKFEYSRIIYVKKEQEKITVYPNPTKDELYVRGINKGELAVIRNQDGKIVGTQTVASGGSLRIDHLHNGLYFLSIAGETRKLVLQK